MKRLLATMLIAVSLLSLAGCGRNGKMTDSGDDTSLYPYGWKENKDGTLTVEIKGEWDDACVWQAEYDESMLSVTPEKKGTRFTASYVATGGADINFYLHREGAEKSEYCIWLYVTILSDGSIHVMDSTHEELLAEGSYVYDKQTDGTMLFTVYTEHPWEYRLLQTNFDVELSEASDTAVTYRISASEKGVGELELWDTESGRKLVVTLIARDGGKVSVDSVEEPDGSEMAGGAVDTFWQELGIRNALPDTVSVSDMKIVTNDSEVSFPYGCMDVTVGGKDYTYYAATDEGLLTYYALEDVKDEDVVIAEASARDDMLNDSIPATVYSRDSETSVTWAADNAYFVLYGEDSAAEEVLAAARQIVGGSNG